METNFDKQLPELDELKQQYKTFNDNLAGQKIVDSQKVTYIVNHCKGYFRTYRRNLLVYYPLAILLMGLLLAMLKVSAVFVVTVASVLFLGFLTELWLTKELTDKSIGESSLAEFAQRAFEAKQGLLIFNIVLICSLFILLFIAIITLDVPDSSIPTIKIAIFVLCGLSVVVFLIRYLPVYRQCSQVIRSVELDSQNLSSRRGMKLFGIAIVAFALITAIFKSLHLPGGTLLMMLTGLFMIAYSIVLAVRLRKRQGTPVVVSLLLIVAMSLMTYLVMAWVNCWPPMRPTHKWTSEFRERPQGDLSAVGTFALREVAKVDETVLDALQEALSQAGVNGFPVNGTYAMASVSVKDTTKVNAIIARINADGNLGKPLLIWTAKDTYLEISPFVWTSADKEERCQLYALKELPLFSGMGQKTPLIDCAEVECVEGTPIRLTLTLTPEANKQWQTAVFGYVQRAEEVNLAVILNGNLIAVGQVDNDYIGYQRITFGLDSNTIFSPTMLDELIQN